MLKINKLTRSYKNGNSYINAIDDITTNFDVGEFVFVLGASGSGKSTLLNVLCGLDTEIQGSVIVDGIDTKDFTKKDWAIYRNRYVGFVFQEYNLIEHLTVWENVALPLQFQGVKKSEAKSKALEELDKVGLSKFANKKPNQISGGQAQRVAIARALVTDPKVIMADEPTGALDTELGHKIIGYLKKVSEERVVVVVTHDEDLAHKYASRIVELSDGKIINDTTSDVVQQEEREKLEFSLPKMNFGMIFRFSRNNIFSRMLRSLSTSAVVSIGYIAIFLLAFLIFGINTSLADTIGKILPEDQYQVLGIEDPVITKADLLNLENFSIIDSARYNPAGFVTTDTRDGKTSVTYQAVPYDEAQLTSMNDMYGSFPENNNEIIVDVAFAARLRGINNVDEDSYEYIFELIEGTSVDLTIETRNDLGIEITENVGTYKIVGLLGSQSFMGGGNIYMEYEEALALSESLYEDNEAIYQVAIVYLNTNDSKKIDELTVTLREEYDLEISNLFSSLTTGIEDTMNTALKIFMGISSVTLIVSGILVGLVVYTSIIERIKEIGILTAIGARKSNIITIFLLEAGMLGLFSSIIATGFALIIMRIINGIFSAIISQPLELLTNGIVDITLLVPKLWIILAVIGFSIVYSMLAGLIPSFRASQLNAVKALRRE